MTLSRRFIAAALSLSLLLAGCSAGGDYTRAAAPSYTVLMDHGMETSATVYVSRSGHKIHKSSNCSGMKNYWTMIYGEALDRGYARCANCF